ncbi:tRNA 5-methylaminomethyl-2-thiouridine biosynthesis bifunctional protein MnmC [Mycobacterium simulans]|nr:tRNA 5-methylaminomethyl-2-thiouridine biosynthesis bifunctional protein MnmC [Mycobacterium simulans]
MLGDSGETSCLIVGGGPAGMMLGLLLARRGIDVTLMEKHADFLRDFRGGTVHASTLRLLDELGLGSRFAQVPRRLIDTIWMQLQGQPVDLDLSRSPARINPSPWCRNGISWNCWPPKRWAPRPSPTSGCCAAPR